MTFCNFPSGCKARALHTGDGRCWFHSELPEIVARRKEGRSRGGKVKRKPKVPRTLPEITLLVGRLLADIASRSRTMEGKSAKERRAIARQDAATAHICQVALKCYELSNIAARLDRLEGKHEPTTRT
jgi:hypothetical protein